MPEPVDTPSREFEIPREAWENLLERLQVIPSPIDLVGKVERMRAGRPVDLSPEEEAVIHQAVREWERDVGSAKLPASIRELRGAFRNFVLAYSRGEVEVQWDSRNLLLDRLRGDPRAAEVVSAFGSPTAHPLRLTDEQMAVLRDVVTAWTNEVGVSRLPPGIVRLRGALEEHVRDAQMRDRRAPATD